MARVRFTIAQLMATVFFLGFGFAALRNANEFWASATYTLAIIMVTAATVGALVRKRGTHTTWTGFAAFGWCYILTTQLPFWPPAWLGGAEVPRPLILVEWGFVRLRPFINPTSLAVNEWVQYDHVSHSLGIILFGLVGAVLGRVLAPQEERPTPP